MMHLFRICGAVKLLKAVLSEKPWSRGRNRESWRQQHSRPGSSFGLRNKRWEKNRENMTAIWENLPLVHVSVRFKLAGLWVRMFYEILNKFLMQTNSCRTHDSSLTNQWCKFFLFLTQFWALFLFCIALLCFVLNASRQRKRRVQKWTLGEPLVYLYWATSTTKYPLTVYTFSFMLFR